MLDAPSIGFPAAGFLLGLASGVHCIGMCGGIVAAFSSRASNVIRAPREKRSSKSIATLSLFNAGRVSAYTLGGAVAGALGGAGAYAASIVDLQVAFYALANLMLVMIG